MPLFTGTLLVSLLAMLIAVPIRLMAAIYLSEYAPRKVRSLAKPVLEVLAGIPTVVYGSFAALTVAPNIRDLGASMRLDVSFLLEDTSLVGQVLNIVYALRTLADIGDHAGNIAEQVVFVARGRDVRYQKKEILVEALRQREGR